MMKFGAVVGAGLLLSGCYVGGYGEDGSRWVVHVDEDTEFLTAVSDTGLLCNGVKDDGHEDQWESWNKVDMKRLFLTCSTSSDEGELGPVTHVIIGGYEDKKRIPEFSDQIADDDPTTYYQVKWRLYDKNMDEDVFLKEYIIDGKTQMSAVARTGDFKKAEAGSEFEATLAEVLLGELRNHGDR